jgi:nitrogen fixation/metabolism regulation signal transduction histidine kinase
VSLRTRLVLALLAMALLPTLVLTLYTRYQIGVASQWWTLPGIERALDSSLKVSRAVVARMDTEMHDQAERFALEPPIAAPSPDERHRMALELDDAGIDLLQTYRRASGGWRLESEYRPLDESDVWEPALGAVLDSALADGGTVHSPLGALGSAARTRDGRVVVAALRVEPHFFDQVALIAHGVEYYRGHGLVADIQRQYAWMLVTALVLALVAVAGVLATSQAGQISRPLAELSDALGRIAAGDWHARVAPRGALEMRRLGQAFNSMAERLEAAMAAAGGARGGVAHGGAAPGTRVQEYPDADVALAPSAGGPQRARARRCGARGSAGRARARRLASRPAGGAILAVRAPAGAAARAARSGHAGAQRGACRRGAGGRRCAGRGRG